MYLSLIDFYQVHQNLQGLTSNCFLSGAQQKEEKKSDRNRERNPK